MHIKKKKIAKLITGAIMLIVLLYTYLVVQIYRYSCEFVDVQSDVAIVLGAGSSGGNISPVFKERCNHALHLFQSKKVKTIIVTGGLGEGEVISDSKAGRLYLIKSGIPQARILIEEQSQNTIENLVYANQIMLANTYLTALIVSDPLHMKRSMKIAELLGMKAQPSPTPSTMYRSGQKKMNLCLSEARYYLKLQFVDRFFNSDFE